MEFQTKIDQVRIFNKNKILILSQINKQENFVDKFILKFV